MSLTKKQLEIATNIYMNIKNKDITLEQVIEELRSFSWNIEGLIKADQRFQQKIEKQKEQQIINRPIKFQPGHILFVKEQYVGINYDGVSEKGFRPFIVLFARKDYAFLVALTSNLNSHIAIKHWNEETEKYRTSFMNIENNYLWTNSKIIAHIREGAIIASSHPAEVNIQKLQNVFLSINSKLNYLFKVK